MISACSLFPSYTPAAQSLLDNVTQPTMSRQVPLNKTTTQVFNKTACRDQQNCMERPCHSNICCALGCLGNNSHRTYQHSALSGTCIAHTLAKLTDTAVPHSTTVASCSTSNAHCLCLTRKTTTATGTGTTPLQHLRSMH